MLQSSLGSALLSSLTKLHTRFYCVCVHNAQVAVPDAFMRIAAKEAGIASLPPAGEYAVGNIFVPKFPEVCS